MTSFWPAILYSYEFTYLHLTHRTKLSELTNELTALQIDTLCRSLDQSISPLTDLTTLFADHSLAPWSWSSPLVSLEPKKYT